MIEKRSRMVPALSSVAASEPPASHIIRSNDSDLWAQTRGPSEKAVVYQ